EGMYFAARTMLMKFGQTLGLLLFAALLMLGKDINNDWGIRLSGLAGFLLFCIAIGIFYLYPETETKQKLEHLREKN
ncbi:MAG: MFS transporter, partial [Bacteroidia bacterium]|nr:MFS transporter [Bacteroidia bacterium]